MAGLALLGVARNSCCSILAGLPLVETLSVIAQVVSYRGFRRRVLRMAPIHHHFEVGGWSEFTVIVRFWLFSAICVGARRRHLLRRLPPVRDSSDARARDRSGRDRRSCRASFAARRLGRDRRGRSSRRRRVPHACRDRARGRRPRRRRARRRPGTARPCRAVDLVVPSPLVAESHPAIARRASRRRPGAQRDRSCGRTHDRTRSSPSPAPTGRRRSRASPRRCSRLRGAARSPRGTSAAR